jgi:hypothetical protein
MLTMTPLVAPVISVISAIVVLLVSQARFRRGKGGIGGERVRLRLAGVSFRAMAKSQILLVLSAFAGQRFALVMRAPV